MSDATDDEYVEEHSSRMKLRKLNNGRPQSSSDPVEPFLSFEPLHDSLAASEERLEGSPESFEDIIGCILPDLLDVRTRQQERITETDERGQTVRPPTRSEAHSIIDRLNAKDAAEGVLSIVEAVLRRKLKLEADKRRLGLPLESKLLHHNTPLSPLTASPVPPVNPQVLNGLYSIRTTAYQNSFLSRIHGTILDTTPSLIATDWETRSPWMDLMDDIRSHHVLAHPESDHPTEALAPIEYVALQASHLPQVHDLLSRVFWPGISVSDSLQHSPEKSTVVAMYKHLVVGAAFLSSPQETYITYLAVRAGWENAQIATTMLYHLIVLNPKKDITLHVSANNSAMLLYNRFGFKAEEFVAGFYEDYLSSQSRASKNAFLLRLRR